MIVVMVVIIRFELMETELDVPSAICISSTRMRALGKAKQAHANPIPVQGQHKKLHIVSNISKSILQSLTFSAEAAFAIFFPLNSE